MDFPVFFLKLILSLALGGLIGIDREKSKKGYPAGIRTLALISLLGFLSSFVSDSIENTYFLIASTFLVFILLIVGYGVSFNTEKFFGFTSTIVIFLTFVIGVISYYEEYYYFAVSLSIIITALLSQKTFIHDMVSKLEYNELIDALKFGIVAFIILPILPNTTIDPLNVFNPYSLWLLVVLILSVSYVGYALSKIIGKSRGVYVSGFLGGIVSSTAVTSSLSYLSKKSESLSDSCVIGITLSNTASMLMILIESFIVNFEFGLTLIMPLAFCFTVGMIISYFSIKALEKKAPLTPEMVSESPFNFIPAIKFTALIALTLFLSKIALIFFGDSGLYLASFFSSFASTSSVIVSISTLVKDSIIMRVAWIATAICIITNSTFKIFLAKKNGSKSMLKKLLINYALMNTPLIIWVLLVI